MSIAQLRRLFESKARVYKRERQEKATFHYILADLIGRSVSRIYSKTAELPQISAIYPDLFTKEETDKQLEEKNIQLSTLRFRQFANSYNKKYKEVAQSK